jgi:ABC-2 type transport system permease protein
MKLLRLKAIAKKELIQIRRDPLSLAMAFLMPVILLFIFGYAITLDVDNISTVVYDLDKSNISREFIREFKESGYFSIVGYADRQDEIDGYLDSGKAKAAISIPEDFSKKLRTGMDAHIQIVVDGSNSNTATIALGYATGISDLYAARLTGGRIRLLIDARTRVWYNPELKSRNFIIPGLIAVIMSIIAALLTSLTIAREWERGTMEQLISTPVKTTELILGKLMPYFLIGFIDMIISILIVIYLFGVPLKGNILLLTALSSIFLFGGLSMGILISIMTKSQIVACQASLIVSYLPALLLSGFMFSIFNMPKPLQIFTYFIPARYFVAVLKGIFLKGNTLSFLLLEALLLSVFGAAVFVLAVKKFKKRIE